MSVLTEKQIKELYFERIGGFPPEKIVHEVKDYNGQERLCIACTQLDYHYSDRDAKRILAEWLDFLQTNTKAFKALHFNSRVPQRLIDAASCQENLEELRFKWGAYSDLSSLDNLKNLQYLYIGSGASVRDITPLASLKNLIVLHVENFKRIEDYSILASLDKLEQLIISGSIYGYTPVKDFEFLRDMHTLVSIWTPGIVLRRKYTNKEFERLCEELPKLHFV